MIMTLIPMIVVKYTRESAAIVDDAATVTNDNE